MDTGTILGALVIVVRGLCALAVICAAMLSGRISRKLGED